MEPITVIVSALAAGASAGLKDTAAASIKDAYAALKRLLGERYGAVELAPVEKRPDSQAKRSSLEEDLRDAGAAHDGKLLDAARLLIDEVRKHDPAAGGAIGIDLDRVQAAALRIRDVHASGGAVRVREGTFSGDIDIAGVRAGRPPERP